MRAWRKKEGFNDIGYHYLILLDGTTQKGCADNFIGYHCKNHNTNSIGVRYVGGLIKIINLKI